MARKRDVMVVTCYWVVSFLVGGYCYPSLYSDLDHCLLVTQNGNVLLENGIANACSEDNTCNSGVQFMQHAPACSLILSKVTEVYSKEPLVDSISVEDIKGGDWLSDAFRTINNGNQQTNCSVFIFRPAEIDRECLMTPLPTGPGQDSNIFTITSNTDTSAVVDFVNQHCHTFRDVDGDLNHHGLHERYIQQNLFSVSSLKDHVKSENAFPESEEPAKAMPECERVEVDMWDHFFMDYLQLSRPVIITNAMKTWNASRKWSNEFLKRKFGDKSVHIKLSPSTDYEGIEDAELWQSKNVKFKIPSSVLAKLPFPDLVVPRPAPANMKFKDYIDLMESIANGSISNASAYLEYSSIPNYFPELREDIAEMPFVDNNMDLKHLNIWLSDGRTLGKLHFDPFDNFLCMIDGKKQLTLFEPHNNDMMYEAHIPEAQFSVDLKTLQFRRDELLESTSMVMSPFDIKRPNFERFPKFRRTMPLNCTINEGEALFMPAFWWHEVQSSPNSCTNRNLAINFWYEPFLTKNFPCPECKLKVNPKYFHLL